VIAQHKIMRQFNMPQHGFELPSHSIRIDPRSQFELMIIPTLAKLTGLASCGEEER